MKRTEDEYRHMRRNKHTPPETFPLGASVIIVFGLTIICWAGLFITVYVLLQ